MHHPVQSVGAPDLRVAIMAILKNQSDWQYAKTNQRNRVLKMKLCLPLPERWDHSQMAEMAQGKKGERKGRRDEDGEDLWVRQTGFQ